MHTSCSTGFIEVAVNNVNGNWVEQINTPKFEIVNQAAKSINIYLPSVIKIGEPTKVKLAAMDQFSNWAIDFVGSINLQSSDGLAEFPSSVQFSEVDKGYKEIMVVFNSIGNQSIKGTIPSMANKVVVSNQAIVSQEITKMYFGEIFIATQLLVEMAWVHVLMNLRSLQLVWIFLQLTMPTIRQIRLVLMTKNGKN